MSLLILRDATKAPELFEKSANVYVRMAEEDVIGKSAYIKMFKVEDLESARCTPTAPKARPKSTLSCVKAKQR